MDIIFQSHEIIETAEFVKVDVKKPKIRFGIRYTGEMFLSRGFEEKNQTCSTVRARIWIMQYVIRGTSKPPVKIITRVWVSISTRIKWIPFFFLFYFNVWITCARDSFARSKVFGSYTGITGMEDERRESENEEKSGELRCKSESSRRSRRPQ